MPNNLSARQPRTDDDKIVQIVPAVGVESYFLHENGSEGRPHPVLLWGLTRGGEVHPLHVDLHGSCDFADQAVNFSRLEVSPAIHVFDSVPFFVEIRQLVLLLIDFLQRRL